MKKEHILPENLIKVLLDIPESGMGFQIVDLQLKKGKILKDVLVLNSSIAMLDDDIEVSQIIGIVKEK